VLAAAKNDATDYEIFYRQHASMAGLLNAPSSRCLASTKHAGWVSLSETSARLGAGHRSKFMLHCCVATFVPTGITQSHRSRPSDLRDKGVNPRAVGFESIKAMKTLTMRERWQAHRTRWRNMFCSMDESPVLYTATPRLCPECARYVWMMM
jgi:hypothetical protein